MSSVNDGYNSSDDEDSIQDGKGASSSVLLGFVDGPITEGDRPTIEDSFVGGEPVWFSPSSPPPSEMLHCKNCSSPMALLSQSFAPWETALYDRIIYIFACKSPSCRRKKGSIKAIRAVQKDPTKMAQLETEKQLAIQSDLDQKLKLEEQKKLEIEATKDIFGPSSSAGASNPFATASTSSSNPFASNPFQAPPKKASDFNKDTPKLDKVIQNAASKFKSTDTPSEGAKNQDKVKLKKYPGFFIYVEEEAFKKKKKDDFKMTSKVEELDQSVLDTEFEDTASLKSKMSDDISRVATSLDDPTFGNFSNTISYNSQQVMRYDLGGSPLLYSSKDDVYKVFVNKDGQINIPNPGYNPSSSRQFELQLMPKVIIDLESDLAPEELLDGMEWGTIIVCTDVEDYVPKLDQNHVGYVEEWCGVQWEEEVKR